MITQDDIEQATAHQLREYAAKLGVTGASRKPKEALKAELIAQLPNQGKSKSDNLAHSQVFVQQVSVMTDLSEIQKACEELITKLSLDKLEGKSKSNKARPYTTPFKDIEPTPETQHLFYDYQREGYTTAINRHVVFKFLGLDDLDFTSQKSHKQNSTEIGSDILEVISKPNNVFSVEKHLKTITRLINSPDPWELGVGLIAASGCRPIEIVFKADFAPLETKPAHILYPEYGAQIFDRAKKRGKLNQGFISLLIPSEIFLEKFNQFRENVEIKQLHEYAQELKTKKHSDEEIAKLLDNKYGKPLRDVTNLEFYFLPKIEDEGVNRTNILLRATYSKLIAYRDLPEHATYENRLKYAGLMTGHISTITHEDGRITYVKADEKNLANTLHYADYEPDTTEIEFLPKEYFKVIVNKKLEINEMARITELESIIEDLKIQLEEKDSEIAALKQRAEPKPPVGEMTNEELSKSRKKGSSDEKLKRCFMAIAAYNNDTPEDRLNPTARILSDMTGCNRGVVAKWLDGEQKDEIISHRAKFGMDEYYNNRYRNHKDYITTEMLMEKIEREYMPEII